ncbi:MAG: hypothetical protein RID07_00090, partial [Lacipirellulaceae bacterium]
MNYASLRVAADAGVAMFRIRDSDLSQLEKHIFKRYPSREWGTFFRFGFRRTKWGIAIYFIEGIWPEPGDLDRQSGMTKFHENYSRRAFHESGNHEGLAVGVIHSHPVDCPVRPSDLDDDMDSYFASEMTAFSGGRPYCSLIFERSAEGLSFSGRIYDRGVWLPVESLISVGPHVSRWRSQLLPDMSCLDTLLTESPTARLQSVMGPESKQRLRDAVVGVIGNSGTGSPAIEVLARAGVGKFILVDPQ